MNLSLHERTVLAEAGRIKATHRKAAKAARPAKVRPTAPNQRKPRLRDNGHLQYVRRFRCIVSTALGIPPTSHSDAAHVRSSYPEPGWIYTGKAEKPDDWRTLPLSREMHEAQHARGDERAWWAEQGLYPPAMVAVLVAARAAGRDGIEVLHEAISAGRSLPSPAPAEKRG